MRRSPVAMVLSVTEGLGFADSGTGSRQNFGLTVLSSLSAMTRISAALHGGILWRAPAKQSVVSDEHFLEQSAT